MRQMFLRGLLEQCGVKPGSRILVAISGGADSVALLRLLRSVSAELSLELAAAHLDHALRPESARDAEFVSRLCEEAGVPLTCSRLDVAAVARGRKQGVEEAARDVRREFLSRVASDARCHLIALGHHRGDQAETVAHRLVRGSGLSGLVAMRPRSGTFIRPLLPFSRQQLLAYLVEEKAAFVEDSSNTDVRYTRNRIRHELLPLLKTFNPRVEEQLARLSRCAALEEDYWEREELRVLGELTSFGADGAELNRTETASLHPALRARILRRALERVRGSLDGITARHVASLEALVCGARSQADLDLPGAWAGVRYTRLLLRRSAPVLPPPFALTLGCPGVFQLPGGGKLHLSMVSAGLGEEAPWVVEFDATRVPLPLTVRSFRAGDRFRPSGMEGHKKLKDFFIDARIERERRRRLPLVVGREILWVVGVRRCQGWRPVEGGPVLRLEAVPADNSLVKSEGL